MDGLCWLYNHRAHVVSSFTELVFLTYMNQKQKFTSPSATQVKKSANNSQYGPEIRRNKATRKRLNELLTYAITILDLLIVV